MLAVCSVIVLAMHLFDGMTFTEGAKNFVYWAMVASWIVGAVSFSVDFGQRNELSTVLKGVMVCCFGCGLSLLGLLFMSADLLTEIVMSTPFVWASLGFFNASLFITGLLMEIQWFSHLGRKDWKCARLWGTHAGGFIVMAIAVILTFQFGLLPLKEVVIIAFSLFALAALTVSTVIIIGRRIMDVIVRSLEKGVGELLSDDD